MRTLFLVLGISLSASASASDCTPLDLRDPVLGDVRNQKEMSWCYAYSMADLIAHHYRLPRISGADVATTYNQGTIPAVMRRAFEVYYRLVSPEKLDSEHETGFMAIALRRALDRGVCLESDFPSDRIERVSARGTEKIEMSDAIAEIHRQKKSGTRDFSYRFRGVDEAEYFRILASASERKLFYEFTERACAGRRIASLPKAALTHRVRGAGMMKDIDSALETGAIVAIDYLPSFLENLDAKPAGLHTSTLVGRRSTANGCEYLVRNSWGTGCTRYDPRLDCDRGHVWVPEKYLRSRVIDYLYLR